MREISSIRPRSTPTATPTIRWQGASTQPQLRWLRLSASDNWMVFHCLGPHTQTKPIRAWDQRLRCETEQLLPSKAHRPRARRKPTVHPGRLAGIRCRIVQRRLLAVLGLPTAPIRSAKPARLQLQLQALLGPHRSWQGLSPATRRKPLPPNEVQPDLINARDYRWKIGK
jgi:hypothetical protein